MDRSYLSQPEVIAASRNFVCVRLATYEDQAEGKFLKSLMRTASGELENSVFGIMSSDGTTPLIRTARSPKQHYADAAQMAQAMERIARDHPAKTGADDRPKVLPLVANVRLALDVAACDNQPLVLIHGADEAGRRDVHDQLAALAWSPEFIGRFLFASTGSAGDLKVLNESPRGGGVLVIQPDRFGVNGTVLAQVTASATKAELAACLREGAERHRSPDGTFAGHVRAGRQQGVFWGTVIPVTDPMERQARERGKRERQ